MLLKINKAKQNREDFEALVASSADRLDFYYDSLVSFVEEERLRSHKELLRIKNGVTEHQFRESRQISGMNSSSTVHSAPSTTCFATPRA